jgi:hypothetical protein
MSASLAPASGTTFGRFATRFASHSMGWLRLVPRGSKLTTSNRAATAAGTTFPASTRSTPEPPGPPGMNTSVPARLPVAFARTTATSMVPVDGRA